MESERKEVRLKCLKRVFVCMQSSSDLLPCVARTTKGRLNILQYVNNLDMWEGEKCPLRIAQCFRFVSTFIFINLRVEKAKQRL